MTSDLSPTPLERLVREVAQSPKYRFLSPEFIASVGARELAVRGPFKEAVKATKRKLHQVTAAYVQEPAQYRRWLERLRAAHAEGEEAFQTACREVMATHASSRERLPILERFYREPLASLAPISRVLDIACGLGPLGIPWMPLAPQAQYVAYDVDTALMAFLHEFLTLAGLEGRACAADVLQGLSEEGPFDVAYVLKALPCLEHIAPGCGERLLEELPARAILVSFPVASLGGRAKGMPAHYEAYLKGLIASKPWRIERFLFETELAFLIEKG